MSAAPDSDSRHSWALALALVWALLGMWTLADGERLWLGVAQLALAASFVMSTVHVRRTAARSSESADTIAP